MILPQTKLDALLARHAAVEVGLRRQLPPDIHCKAVARVRRNHPVVDKIKAYRSVAAEIADLEALIADPKAEAAMREMADDERRTLEEKRKRLFQELRVALLPKDAVDERNVILEIRAGTGGDEAALFAGDLFRMYERYAERQGWQRRGDRPPAKASMGGFKEVVAEVTRPRRLRQAEVRERRAPRAARAGHRGAGPHPHLGGDRRGAARARGGRRRDRATTI